MADDNNLQNRTSNSSERETANSGQGADPLAELARLIGQNDPFSEFGRDARGAAPVPPRPMPREQPVVAPPYLGAQDQSGGPAPYQMPQSPPAFIQASSDSDHYRDAGYPGSGHAPAGNEFYDEAEPRGGGRRFMTAAAVVALAVLGTAGAFGYRFIFSGSGSNTPPPVIRANSDPTKVAPAASAESAQVKSTYDRVASRDQNQGERMVAREEPPVDVKDLSRPGVGRSPPPANQANQWAQATAPNLPPVGSTASAGAIAPSAMGEPKKVRTVTIRPDPADSNMAPTSLLPPSAAGVQPAPSARSAASAPPVPVQQRQFAAAPPAAPPPANAPLALNDDSSLSLPRSLNEPPPAARVRQAPAPRPAAAPPARQAAPVPQALAQVAAPKGSGYLVQVSSQRSEAEAQAALRSLQAKYPAAVGGQPATIRRAELGERGVFFRAMLGPFVSRDEATQLCTSLKAAGGSCIVQGN